MKVDKLIIIGFLSLLFGIKLYGQSNLVDITSKSRKGFHDLVLNIVDKQLDNDVWIITAKGLYKDSVVGIKLNIMVTQNELT